MNTIARLITTALFIGLTGNGDHEGLVAELVDVGRHRPEPGHKGEIENGGHGLARAGQGAGRELNAE